MVRGRGTPAHQRSAAGRCAVGEGERSGHPPPWLDEVARGSCHPGHCTRTTPRGSRFGAPPGGEMPWEARHSSRAPPLATTHAWPHGACPGAGRAAASRHQQRPPGWYTGEESPPRLARERLRQSALPEMQSWGPSIRGRAVSPVNGRCRAYLRRQERRQGQAGAVQAARMAYIAGGMQDETRTEQAVPSTAQSA